MQNTIFLAQSDTTAGFLSKNKETIIHIKQSKKNKPILLESSAIDTIKIHSRIPQVLSKHIRRMKKTTFIFPNKQSFRVVRESLHLQFLKKYKILYSSSANLTNKAFSYTFAYENANMIIIDKRGIYESKPSNIFEARKQHIRKIR